MGWDGPILTDSGGFQVFSLRDTLLGRRRRRRHVPLRLRRRAGALHSRASAEIQRRLGSDIAMCLDVCPPAACRASDLERAVERTTAWARAPGRGAARPTGSCASASPRAATDPELRRRSIEEVAALAFDGYALGGLAVGEDRGEMLDAVGWAAPLLPADGRATSWASATPRASSR